MLYRKKPVVIEAITFEELVIIGLSQEGEEGVNIVKGEPWAFTYKGYPITQENSKCYIISTLEGNYNFTPNDMLITGVEGEIYPCKKDIFNQTYEKV